jgi:hypothetical protein
MNMGVAYHATGDAGRHDTQQALAAWSATEQARAKQIAEMRARYAAGDTLANIAKAFGYKTRQRVFQLIVGAHGEFKRKSPRPHKPFNEEEAYDRYLHDYTVTVPQLATEYGITFETMIRRFRQRGWTATRIATAGGYDGLYRIRHGVLTALTERRYALYLQGYSADEIGKMEGTAASCIVRMFNNAGLPMLPTKGLSKRLTRAERQALIDDMLDHIDERDRLPLFERQQ